MSQRGRQVDFTSQMGRWKMSLQNYSVPTPRQCGIERVRKCHDHERSDTLQRTAVNEDDPISLFPASPLVSHLMLCKPFRRPRLRFGEILGGQLRGPLFSNLRGPFRVRPLPRRRCKVRLKVRLCVALRYSLTVEIGRTEIVLCGCVALLSRPPVQSCCLSIVLPLSQRSPKANCASA